MENEQSPWLKPMYRFSWLFHHKLNLVVWLCTKKTDCVFKISKRPKIHWFLSSTCKVIKFNALNELPKLCRLITLSPVILVSIISYISSSFGFRYAVEDSYTLVRLTWYLLQVLKDSASSAEIVQSPMAIRSLYTVKRGVN